MADNDGRFPDGSPVQTPYPLTAGQHRGDRAAWPWLPGRVLSQCGPDEWEIHVLAPELADEDGTFPVAYRDASEIRPQVPR